MDLRSADLMYIIRPPTGQLCFLAHVPLLPLCSYILVSYSLSLAHLLTIEVTVWKTWQSVHFVSDVYTTL